MSNENRFNWRTWIVTPAEVDKALQSTDLETYDIQAIHVLPPDPKNELTRVMIVARQSFAVTSALSAIRSKPNVQGFPYPDKHDPFVQHNGVYTSSCGHIKRAAYAKGNAFQLCGDCNSPVQWKIVDLD